MRAALLLMALAGCAVGPGEPMGTVDPRIEARYITATSREAPGGFQRLASSYELRVTRFELTAPDFLLVGGSAGAASTGFDPANPPPGYTNCHGGHCHADDGSLPTYEEIAARIGGGGATSSTVLTIPAGALNLLSGTSFAEPACVPDCTLQETTIRSVSVPLTQLALEGVVRDGRSPARISERSFSLLLPLSDLDPIATISSPLELSIDRESEPHVELTLRLSPTAAIFDGVDWAAATTSSDGSVALETPENLAHRLSILDAFISNSLVADVQRSSR